MKFCAKAFLSLIILLCCAHLSIHAQKATTDTNSFPVDSTKFFHFTEDNFAYGKTASYQQLRNDLDGFQNFRERHANTGNAGSPQKELYLPAISPETFRSRPSTFNYFGYTKNNRRFYDSERPYTKLQLILGQKEELNVGMTHAHPFGKNCNVALGFNRVRSAGFYQRQNTNNTSINLNGWYRAPGKRYTVLSDVYWTIIKVAENGGIAHDSDFQFRQLDRRLVEVKLSAAENRQQMRGAWVKQYWSFGAIGDTISDRNDTVNYRTNIYPSWAIVHTVGIYDEKYVYYDRDPRAGFYANVLRDTLVTNDSTYTWKVENGLWLERFQLHDKNALRQMFGKIGVRHESGEIFNDTIYKHFSNFLIDGNLDYRKATRFITEANLKAWYVLNGYNKGDYFIHAHFGKAMKYSIAAEQKRQHPDFIYSHYSGNHFAWINEFFPSTQTDATATGLKFFGKSNLVAFTAGFHNYARPVYFNKSSLPAQLAGSVNAISGRLYVSLGSKSIKSKTDISWNKLPASSPIRLPEFVVRQSLYGNFRLFKKALQLQAGIDATWLSSFDGDKYNPNISQFYIQDSTSIGNYLFLDAWVSIKIKPVRVFVKADHVNAGMFGRKYYLIPGYPQNDFALKFGLSWVFND
jgi:hypothetical protein